MSSRQNRYSALIDKIFFDHYVKGATSLDFKRQELKDASASLGIPMPDNLSDVLYAFRFRPSCPSP